MYICEDVDKATLGKAIDWLQETLDDDFLCQAKNAERGQFRQRDDVAPTLPGFTTGVVNMANIRVNVPTNFYKR